MATVLVIDEHPLARQFFKTHVGQIAGVTSILEASNEEAALAIMRLSNADAVILGLGMYGLDLIPRIKTINPDVRIIVMSMREADAIVHRARLAGAHGFVSKAQRLNDIIRCVNAVLAGASAMPER